MTVKLAEQTVHSDDGHVVRVSADSIGVTVAWHCGDVRSFTYEGIAEAVANARLTAEEHPDVWTVMQDRNGDSYAIRIQDGELYADNDAGRDSNGAHVPWVSMRKAIRRAVKQHEREQKLQAEQAQTAV